MVSLSNTDNTVQSVFTCRKTIANLSFILNRTSCVNLPCQYTFCNQTQPQIDTFRKVRTLPRPCAKILKLKKKNKFNFMNIWKITIVYQHVQSKGKKEKKKRRIDSKYKTGNAACAKGGVRKIYILSGCGRCKWKCPIQGSSFSQRCQALSLRQPLLSPSANETKRTNEKGNTERTNSRLTRAWETEQSKELLR